MPSPCWCSCLYGPRGRRNRRVIGKILLASPRPFYPLRSGAARSSHQLIRRLIGEQNIEVRVLSRRDPTVRLDRRDHGALNIRTWCDTAEGLAVDCGYSICFVDNFEAALHQMLNEFAPDVVWSQLEDAVSTLALCRKRGIPGLLYVRDDTFDRKTVARAVRDGVTIVCNSRYLVRRVENDAGVRAHLAYSIHNERLGVKGDQRGVCTFVNPVSKKGFETFLKIAVLMPETRFLVVESWPLSVRRLNDVRGRLAGLSNVSFMRRVADVRRVFECTRVLLVPSVWNESVPRVVREAQSCAIPVLASRRGALAECVDKGGGCIDEYLDARAWASAIHSLSCDSHYLELSHGAEQDWNNPVFDADRNVRSFLGACEQALGSKPQTTAKNLKDRLLSDTKHWGLWRTLCFHFFSTLRSHGVFLCWVHTREMSDHQPREVLPANVTVERLSTAACHQAARNPALDLPPEFVTDALARGDMCHAARVDGKVVSYAWRSCSTAPADPGIEVCVPSGYSYGYKAFTLPDHRGQGIYPAIASAEISSCQTAGLTHGVSFTEVYDYSFLNAEQKFGNTRVGLAGYVRIGRKIVTFSCPAVKTLGLRFEAAPGDKDLS